ncbi:MAG: hypothetical protein OXF88_02195 [Rhodobacteraceae bacterium]|nr:hypothetical protein [Paracoccaceae bacterium]MCY4137267.1 hypothetical protein [Paracoccaceae bacterium]
MNVAFGTGTAADLTLSDVPVLGTLQQDSKPVSGGRLTAAANSQSYTAVGQFGGTNQGGVADHLTNSNFRSVFNRQSIPTSHQPENTPELANCVPNFKRCPVRPGQIPGNPAPKIRS